MRSPRIYHRRDSAIDWTRKNPILGPGEIGVEEDTGKFKMGNGLYPWSDLPYFLPDEQVIAFIENAVDNLPSGEVSQQDLDDHVNAAEPHPAYDDMPSLRSLYQNAKV